MGKGDGSLFPFLEKRDTFKEKGKENSFLFEKEKHSIRQHFNKYNISIPSLVSEYIFTYLGYSNTKFKKKIHKIKKFEYT